MNLLLVHQNFPGQFRQLAPYLEQQGHQVVAICSHQRPVALRGPVLRYDEPQKGEGLPLGTQLWHDGLQRAAAVARLCDQLRRQGWRPDRILAHSGWAKPWRSLRCGPMCPSSSGPSFGCCPSMAAMATTR